jgi:hypothetical protein
MVRRLLCLALVLCPAQLFAQGGPSLSSVVFKPATVAGGNTATATILLSGPAGNNGFEVSLSISSNVAQLASSAVTVGPGLSSAIVPVTTTPTATLQLATLTATARGDTRTANLTVAPPSVATFTVSPTSINGGQSAAGTVTLDGPAPTAGTVVTLTSSNNVVTVPPSLNIGGGQNASKFSVTSAAVTAVTQATLSATTGGAVRTVAMTVSPAPLTLASFGFSSTSKGGVFNTLVARLSAAAPPGGATVSFTSTGTDVLHTQPKTLTIPQGDTQAFESYRLPVTSTDKPFELIAVLNGITSTKSGTLLAPRITFVSLQESIIGGNSASLRLSLDALPPSSGIPAVVTTDNPAVTVGFPFTSTTQTYSVRTPVVAQPTPVVVTVSYLGTDRTKTITLLPPPPVLTSITATPNPVRAGRTVAVTANLSAPAPAAGAVVQFSVPSTIAGISVPNSITVPAGSTSRTVNLGTPSFLPSSVSITLTGTYEGVSKQVTIRVDP